MGLGASISYRKRTCGVFFILKKRKKEKEKEKTLKPDGQNQKPDQRKCAVHRLPTPKREKK